MQPVTSRREFFGLAGAAVGSMALTPLWAQRATAGGQWLVAGSASLVGIHAALLSNGSVLLFGRPEHAGGGKTPPASADPLSSVLSIGASSIAETPYHLQRNPFC